MPPLSHAVRRGLFSWQRRTTLRPPIVLRGQNAHSPQYPGWAKTYNTMLLRVRTRRTLLVKTPSHRYPTPIGLHSNRERGHCGAGDDGRPHSAPRRSACWLPRRPSPEQNAAGSFTGPCGLYLSTPGAGVKIGITLSPAVYCGERWRLRRRTAKTARITASFAGEDKWASIL